MKRILGLSGGSTKGIGTLGICEELSKKGITYDTIVTTSIGSIIGVPIAMSKFLGSVYEFLNINLNKIFSHPPVAENGDFRWQTLYYLYKFKNSVGDMGNVRKLISGIITEDIFNEYKRGDYAVVYALSVDSRTGKRCIANLKECTYHDYIEYVMGSSSIPIFTRPVYIDDMILYDGGLRDHVGNHLFLDQSYDECYTIFTRPEDGSLDLWSPTNILSVLERTIDIMNVEISKNDEERIDEKCEKYNVKNYKFYLPRVLHSLYDTDHKRLSRLYEEGKKIGRDFKRK